MRDAQTGDSSVELLIFKDQLPSKTVRITSNWVNRLGILVGIVTFVTVSALILTAHYSDLARRSNPERLRALELELSALQERLGEMQDQAKQAATPPAVNGEQPVTPAAPIASAPSVATAGAWVWMPPLKAASGKIPIQITEPRVLLNGRNLSVKFALQYTETDGGKQEGQIFIFVRGASYFLTYPETALTAEAGTGIDLEGGESFSVSRFRAVEAIFTLPRPGQPSEVRALILSSNGSVLLDQKLNSPATSAPAQPGTAPAPSPSIAPKKEPVNANTP